jgi:hypothetical protein
MTEHHQTSRPWEWQLAPGRLARLEPMPVARWLELHEGSLWLTRTVRRGDPPADVWLAAGERVLLPAGSQWLAEAGAAARVATHVTGAVRLSVKA